MSSPATTRIGTVALILWTIAGILVTFVLMVVAGRYAAKPHITPANAAIALGVIGAAAVGIERLLELWWTLVDFFKPGWPDSKRLNKQRTAASTTLDALAQQLAKTLPVAVTSIKEIATADMSAQQQLDAFKTNIAKLRLVSPDDPNLQTLLTATQRGITDLQDLAPAVASAASSASAALTQLTGYLATFKDNPERKLISLFVGAYLGIGLAGIFSLDLIQAALHAGGATASIGVVTYPGVAITGLVVGLGSNPTHELIQALQSFKQSQQSQASA